jgi:spore coat polysaccharide biosynthesis protein SpsF (cytidylyltransferase family)
MTRPIAIIQARIGSTRLPGKVLADLGGRPLLARMIERLRAARTLAGIVVATPDGAADMPLRALVAELDVDCFPGSERAVLSRYAGAAAMSGADRSCVSRPTARSLIRRSSTAASRPFSRRRTATTPASAAPSPTASTPR